LENSTENSLVKKYIVVHAGKRDDYQVALALYETGKLDYLVTEIYAPLDYKIVTFLAVKLKLHNYLIKRYKVGLPSKKIRISYSALWYSILFILTKNIKYDRLKGYALGLKAKKMSLDRSIPIISMNTYAYDAFIMNPIEPKILFQFHPHPSFVKAIFEEEISINSKAKNSLSKEYEFSIPEVDLQKLSAEIRLSNYFICASSVTKKSLLAQGVNEEKINVIPYGVDIEKFIFKKRKRNDTVFRVIFIGSLNQRKGVTYLLDALSGLQRVELTIVGRGIFDKELLSGYSYPIHIKENVSEAELIFELQNANCFVLPSILEGFGQVILEAMATGIPVIASENTAAIDIIDNEKDGFIVPIRDSDKIAMIIEKLQQDEILSSAIGVAAFLKAKEYSWTKFRNEFVKQIKRIENEVINNY